MNTGEKCMPMRKLANLPFEHWPRYSAHVEVSRPTKPLITESLPTCTRNVWPGRLFERLLYNDLELV